MTDNKTQTLKELRASMKDIDMKRRSEHLQDNEREVLEMAAVALRDAERLAIAKIQKQLIKDLQEQTARLNEQSKIIRAKVSAINKVPKVLDSIESAIKMAVKIITAVAKW
ncbi:MAG: hypothetical protein LBQ60_09525 [Bacteroidales bacterium]|jgi:hypothetical protein|nr:hypothetical protein [Bacteroidales bacterium]